MKNLDNKRWILYGLVVVESVIWGFSFVGTKAALENLNPVEVITMRWTIAAVVMVLLAAIGVLKVNFKGKNLKAVMLVAFSQPCIYSICEVYGISLTTTSESAILTSLVPIFVIIISTFVLKNKINKKSILAILLAFMGVICTVVFSPDFSLGGRIIGYLFIIGAVTAGAIFTIGTNMISDRFTAMEVTLVMAVEGSIFFNAVSLVQGNGFKAYVLTFTNIDVFLSVMFLALGCTVICYIIFNIVISKLPPHQASTLQINLITLVGVLSGILIKDDPYGWYTLFGMLLILAGVIITNLQENKSET